MEIQLRQRTPVQTLDLQGLLTHSTHVIMLGSCFAETIGNLLSREMFDITVNPFGTLYNPASIAKSINTLLSDRLYTDRDIFESEGIWHSSDHHSKFSSADPTKVLESINTSLANGRNAASNADLCVITLGTSWVYTDISDGSVVANCHKRPAADFHRMMLPPEQSAMILSAALKRWLSIRPEIIFVLTVSPIRHLADGLHGNSLSKASLMLACNRIIESIGREHAFYFPSYEIMIDDLRDYRWYMSDMKHPSDEAIDYIYRVFAASVMPRRTIAVAELCRRFNARISHRQITDNTDLHSQRRSDDLRRMATDIIAIAPELTTRINCILANEI